ncbi:hypothetical protein FQA39_LY00941 [Lamprigera yunnana]|nr:hypothetical protein FQA39_LY00941 [Lamprigera yunnana]
MEAKQKFKGGAEEQREKKKMRLVIEASKCKKLSGYVYIEQGKLIYMYSLKIDFQLRTIIKTIDEHIYDPVPAITSFEFKDDVTTGVTNFENVAEFLNGTTLNHLISTTLISNNQRNSEIKYDLFSCLDLTVLATTSEKKFTSTEFCAPKNFPPWAIAITGCKNFAGGCKAIPRPRADSINKLPRIPTNSNRTPPTVILIAQLTTTDPHQTFAEETTINTTIVPFNYYANILTGVL